MIKISIDINPKIDSPLLIGEQKNNVLPIHFGIGLERIEFENKLSEEQAIIFFYLLRNLKVIGNYSDEALMALGQVASGQKIEVMPIDEAKVKSILGIWKQVGEELTKHDNTQNRQSN